MNPAQAMGAFIRVWREDWARLSREQLAIAVTASCRRARVTKYAVREWEKGQPPDTTEQLEALTAVMARHGVTPGELKQFHHAVFAALAGRQYPELFSDESLAYREDVDELAATIVRREAAAAPASHDAISLVASVRELEAALFGEPTYRVDRPQARKQHVALARLRSGLTDVHYNAGRLTRAAAGHAVNAECLAAHFGPRGLGPGLSVLDERIWGAYAELLASLLPNGHAAKTSHARVQRLIDLYHEGCERGQRASALSALHLAADGAEALPPDEAAFVLQETERLREEALPLWGRVWWRAMFDAALRSGVLGRAEEHLLAIDEGDNGSPHARTYWLERAGNLALARGSRGEAQDFYERALRLAASLGFHLQVANIRAKLLRCEPTR